MRLLQAMNLLLLFLVNIFFVNLLVSPNLFNILTIHNVIFQPIVEENHDSPIFANTNTFHTDILIWAIFYSGN